MGIPRLASQLRPFAKPLLLKKEDDHSHFTEPLQRVVIDGPSLAFYIFNCCLASRNKTQYRLNVVPSYRRLATAVVEWLCCIEKFGLEIQRIYFDGALPRGKLSTRLSRLQKNLKQLNDIKHSFASPFANLTPGRTTPGNLPPQGHVSFLVAATIEALLDCKFGPLTFVVPDEADQFCAAEDVHGTVDLVLTSDSDLLLLIKNARVVLLSDLEFGLDVESCEILRGLVFSPRDIATSINCNDLVKLGYYIWRNPRSSLQQSMALAASHPEMLERDWSEFSNGYRCRVVKSALVSWKDNWTPMSPAQELLTHLDPRISEFVQSWMAHLEHANSHFPGADVSDVSKSDELNMFLPFLIDDPNKGSGWRDSLFIRRIAYSLLAPHTSRVPIGEVDRRGERVAATSVQLLPRTGLGAALFSLRTSLQAKITDGTAAERWRSLALLLLVEHSTEQGGALPTRGEILAVFGVLPGSRREYPQNSGAETRHKLKTWEHVHLLAKAEAMLYSLRILLQVANVYLYCNFSDGDDADFTAQLRAVVQDLQSMPRLSELFASLRDGLPVGAAAASLEPQLASSYATMGLDVEANGKKAARDKKEGTNASDAGAPTSRSTDKALVSNMYALLAEES